MPANVAEEMLQTELFHYQNNEYKGVSIVRAAAAYSLPVEIAEHVSIVGDILRFPRLRQKLQIEQAKPDGADTGDDVGGPLFEDEAEEVETPLTDRPAGQEAADDTAHTMPIDRGITDADDGPGSELENEIELGRRRRPRGNER